MSRLAIPATSTSNVYDSSTHTVRVKITINNYSSYPSGTQFEFSGLRDNIIHKGSSSLSVDALNFFPSRDQKWSGSLIASCQGYESSPPLQISTNVSSLIYPQFALPMNNLFQKVSTKEKAFTTAAGSGSWVNFFEPVSGLDPSNTSDILYGRLTVLASRDPASGETFGTSFHFDRNISGTIGVNPSGSMLGTSPVTLSVVGPTSTYHNAFGGFTSGGYTLKSSLWVATCKRIHLNLTASGMYAGFQALGMTNVQIRDFLNEFPYEEFIRDS